jgi:periplasmic divalent cation tolerance protein
MDSVERYVVVMVTVPDEELGKQISWQVVNDRLAACVNRIKISSTYRWEGEVHNEDEELLLIKTSLASLDRLKEKVLEMHPYDVPEIIALPVISGHTPYLNWITESVARES